MKSEKKYKKNILNAVLWSLVTAGLLLSVLQYLGVSFDVQAGYSKTLPFQGRLTNPDGTNVADGDYNIKFRIYNTEKAENASLWQEEHTGKHAVAVEDSVFDVMLGTITPINLDFNTGTYWLEIEVNGETLSPRRRIGGTGYSINTDNVTGVPGSLSDTNLNGFPASERGVIDALNYLLSQVGGSNLWTDTGTALRPQTGASSNVDINSGTLTVSGATSFGSTLAVSGIITGPTNETINGIDINSGTISDATWNGNQISDNYVVALAGASQGDVLYHNGTQWVKLTAGTSGHFLMTQGVGADPMWNAVSGGLANGTVDHSTLHWDDVGSSWVENTTLLTTGTSLYGSGDLTLYAAGTQLILGDVGATTSITSSDWAISSSGNMTDIGTFNSDGIMNVNNILYVDAGSGEIGVNDVTPTYGLDVNGTGRFTGNLDAEAGIDITNNALNMGSQNITGVGTNITATAALNVVASGADLTLTGRGASTTLNEFGDTSLSGFTATSIIGALNELAAGSGTAGLWLDDVGNDYLYPNSTYSDNVSIDSGTLGVGTTPTTGTTIDIANSSNAGRGINIVMSGTSGEKVGVLSSVTGAADDNFAFAGEVTGSPNADNYGLYTSVTDSASHINNGVEGVVYFDQQHTSAMTDVARGVTGAAILTGDLNITTNEQYISAVNGWATADDYNLAGSSYTNAISGGNFSVGLTSSSSGTIKGVSIYGVIGQSVNSSPAIDALNSTYAYGVYGTSLGTNTRSGINYGIYGSANNADGANWAGFFDSGNVNIENDLYMSEVATVFSDRDANLRYLGVNIVHDPSYPLRVSGDTYISSGGLGVGVAQSTDGYIQANSRIGVAGSPDYPLDVTGQGYITTQLGVGTTPNTSYGVHGYSTAGGGRGVYGQVVTSNTAAYGLYGQSSGTNVLGGTHHGVYGVASGTGGSSRNYGVYGTATGATGTITNYGVYGNAQNGTTNWAGYFNNGDVYIANDLGIGVSPSYQLHVNGDGYITSGLGVGVAQTNTGYIQANSRIGVGVSPSYPLHVSGDGYITSGLGVGVAQTNTGYIQANQRIGVGVSPSYRAHIYDRSLNLRTALYTDFRSTYSGADQAAIYGYNSSVNNSAAIALTGVEGGSSGAGSAGWNIGVYGWAEDNSNQSIGMWGSARNGAGFTAGGYFDVLAASTGDQYGTYNKIEFANNGKINRGVESVVAVGADAYTSWPSDSVAGIASQVNMAGSVNYGGNVPEVVGSQNGLYLAPGYTVQNTGGFGMRGVYGSIYNDGTFSNGADVTGLQGIISGGGTGVYQDSNTWLFGVLGAIEATHWADTPPTYTGVNAVGVHGEARNTNSTGVNYAFHGEVENGQQNYGAFLDVMSGGSGTDYGLKIDIGSNVEYGAYISSGATIDELYVNGTATFTGNISAPNKGAAVSDVVENDSGEVLHEGDVVVLSGADAVHYLFDGKIPVPKVRKSQGEQDSDKLFGVMFQSHKGERYDIQPSEYGFAFTMNAIRKVNVSGENGHIAVGDKLSLSSIPGHVKKAKPGENTLGLALKSHNSSGTGQISVFVQLGYNNQTVAEGEGGKIEAGTVAGDLGINGKLSVSGDVDIVGTLKVSSIWSQNATWHIDSQGELRAQKVQTEELEISEGDNKSIGGVDILVGNSEVLVTNTSVTADSRIFLTVAGDSDLESGVKLKEKRVGEGFVVATGDDEPVIADVEINWLIIN